MSPVLVRFGPNDELLLLDTNSWEIEQLQSNGSLTVYASFPELSTTSGALEHFGFDPSGRLWISTHHGGTYRIADDGSPEWVASAHRVFAFNSQGIMYAVDSPSSNVQRITPEGQVTELAEGFGRAHNIAIGPNDEILVVEQDRGELIQVFEDGHWVKITDGLSIDHSIAVAPDRTVYLMDWSGIQEVDLNAGTKTNLDWYEKYSNSGEKGIFDSAGYMYTFHPNQPIYRLDFQTQTCEMIFHPQGYTWAMAVGPDSRVFAGYGGLVAGSETTLYEITEGDILVPLWTVPYRFPTSITFTPEGIGFLAVYGHKKVEYGQAGFWNGMIYSFDLVNGSYEEYAETKGLPHEIDVDPTTGDLWWTLHQSLWVKRTDGQIIQVSYPGDDRSAQPRHLTFSSDGTLYALIDLPPDGHLLWHNRLYSRDTTGNWTELVVADGPQLGLLSQAICPDGSNYLFGYTWESATVVTDSNRTGLVYAIWKLEDNGILTLLGYDAGSDSFASDCDPITNDVYFITTDGILRLSW
ncbi:MAG: hypothetical protein C0410_11105 [Anaerolinea sp.]|nr:hypothetical protein [Anaerolinea sp.]